MEIEKGIYRHYKGNLYKVLEMVQHSESEEWLVLYQALYGERGLWVRPYEMFMQTLMLEGERVKRFEKVEDEE